MSNLINLHGDLDLKLAYKIIDQQHVHFMPYPHMILLLNTNYYYQPVSLIFQLFMKFLTISPLDMPGRWPTKCLDMLLIFRLAFPSRFRSKSITWNITGYASLSFLNFILSSRNMMYPNIFKNKKIYIC